MNKRILLLFCFLATVFFVWVAKKNPQNSVGEEIVFRVANGADIKGLDPAKVSGRVEHRVLETLWKGLMSYDPITSDPIPALSDGMPKVSKDGVVYTFVLRKDLKWSDGIPLTAHDFEYAFKRMLDPQTGAKYATMLYPIAGAKEFNSGQGSVNDVQAKALDDYTLKVTLKTPTAYFLGSLSHYSCYPHPKHVIEKHGDLWTKPQYYVSSGPFKFKEWIRNSRITVVKNPYFYGAESVKLDKVIFYSTDNYITAYNMFKKGEVDWNTGIYPISIVDELFLREDIHKGPSFGAVYYSFNHSKPPFNDIRIRKAFSLSLNTDALESNVLRDGSISTGAFVPPMKGSVYKMPKFRKTFDPEQAKKFLAEAGYPGGKGFPSITLTYNTSDHFRLISEWAQSEWKKHLGVNVVTRNEEWKVFLANRFAGKYDVVRDGWFGDYKDPITFLELFLSGSLINGGKYQNLNYDKLILQSQNMKAGAERDKIMQNAEEILLKDFAIIPFYVISAVNLIDLKKWGGWHHNSMNIHSIKDVYLIK